MATGFRVLATRKASSRLIAGLAFALLVGIAGSADARLGGGGSFGSRGARTFTMPGSTYTAPRVAPIERSTTAAPFNRPFNSGAFSGSRPGFLGGGFGRGLLGGFLGAGLFGLLFGGGFGGGLGGGMSFIGLLLQLALLFFIARLIIGFFRSRNPAFSNGSMFRSPLGSGGLGSRPSNNYASEPSSRGAPITLGPQDYQVFERILIESQNAYSDGNTSRLRQLATEEMAGNFQRELDDNRREGVVNKITRVQLLNGDLSEAWREPGAEYATVAMRFSLVDATMDLNTGRVVAGDATAPQVVTEVWTFLRPVGAAPQSWILSAIQQS